MIRRTFSFLPGIDVTTEESLRLQGINDWHDFIQAYTIKGMSPKRNAHYTRRLKEAGKALHEGNVGFFADTLAISDHWTLYDHFKDEACFLDIETTGLSHHDDITVVGLFDGINTKTMIKGINLDFEKLRQELSQYKMFVSFNGSVFDMPFIERRYPGVLPKIPHFDLRFACKKIGLVGGLKSIEKELGVTRGKIVGEMHGGDAVTLWRMYKATGDDHYLNLLVEYNEEDVINLKRIADVVYGKLSARTHLV